MPLVFKEQGLRFYFYSNEGDPREPLHVHVTGGGRDAKLWLYPELEIAYNYGFTARELRVLLDIVQARRDEIESGWHDHFG